MTVKDFSKTDKRTILCIHEDREHCLPGAKLSVLSLREHCPNLPIVVSCPNVPSAFADWLSRVPRVELASYPETLNCAWNIKPTVLLRLLQDGYSEAIWVDSDIVAARDVMTPLTRLDADIFGATQETYWGQNQGGVVRTVAWGLKPGREMPCTVNSGVLRVTTAHLELLKDWEQMLKHPIYLRAQTLPWYERPLHMIGDQEVLTALLGSQEYSDVSLSLLRRGVEIAQCMGPGGFTPWERINAFRTDFPGLVHSMGSKPWTKAAQPPRFRLNAASLRAWYEHLHMELTPYISVARQYASALEEDVQWTEHSSIAGKILKWLAFSDPILQGLPLALIDAVARTFRSWFKIARYGVPEEFLLRESPLNGEE
jgi:hypothetical protein